jgi:hypothetical protein
LRNTFKKAKLVNKILATLKNGTGVFSPRIGNSSAKQMKKYVKPDTMSLSYRLYSKSALTLEANSSEKRSSGVEV